MKDTLLAHITRRFAHGTENVATEALKYILSYDEAADAFRSHVRRFAPELPDVVQFDTQSAGDDGKGIWDLLGSTADGGTNTTVVVEVKFGAPLTDNQPVTYLETLAEAKTPALLLFLVPETKAEQLWPRLLDRCEKARLALALEPGGNRRAATFCNVTLGVTTWKSLLDDLAGVPATSDNQQVRHEIEQLRGLCAREDSEGFLPFSRAFLEGDAARPLLDLQGILEQSVRILRQERLARYRRLTWSAKGNGWAGVYFVLADRRALLHLNFFRWGRQAETPLWLRVYPGGDPRVVAAIRGAFGGDQPPRLFDDDGRLMIPIRLPVGEDRDECIKAVTAVVRQAHRVIADLPVLPGAAVTDDELEAGAEEE